MQIHDIDVAIASRIPSYAQIVIEASKLARKFTVKTLLFTHDNYLKQFYTLFKRSILCIKDISYEIDANRARPMVDLSFLPIKDLTIKFSGSDCDTLRFDNLDRYKRLQKLCLRGDFSEHVIEKIPPIAIHSLIIKSEKPIGKDLKYLTKFKNLKSLTLNK